MIEEGIVEEVGIVEVVESGKETENLTVGVEVLLPHLVKGITMTILQLRIRAEEIETLITDITEIINFVN